jgi:hypothetical protein
VMRAAADLDGWQQRIDLHEHPPGMHREGQQSTIRFRKSYSTLGTSVSPHCLEISCKHHHPQAARENQLQQFAKGCQSAACLSVPRESGLELTHCSSPPPANPLLQDKSTFIGSFKTKPPRLSEVYEVCYCIHGTLPLCAASAEWSCTVFDVQGPRPPIPDRTLRRGLHAWPMWRAPKSCAANQCPRCSAAGQASH